MATEPGYAEIPLWKNPNPLGSEERAAFRREYRRANLDPGDPHILLVRHYLLPDDAPYGKLMEMVMLGDKRRPGEIVGGRWVPSSAPGDMPDMPDMPAVRRSMKVAESWLRTAQAGAAAMFGRDPEAARKCAETIVADADNLLSEAEGFAAIVRGLAKERERRQSRDRRNEGLES